MEDSLIVVKIPKQFLLDIKENKYGIYTGRMYTIIREGVEMENVLLLNSVLTEYIEAKRETARARDIRVLEDALEIISEDVAKEERRIADEVKLANWKEPTD